MTCWYHTTPSKLCDACMREQAKAAPAVAKTEADLVAYETEQYALLATGGEPALKLPAEYEAVHAQRKLNCPHEWAGADSYDSHGRVFLGSSEICLLCNRTRPAPDKWEQRAVEFTAEKRAEKLAAVEALCGFAARMAPPPHVYTGVDFGYRDHTVITAIDTERGVITFSSAAKRLEAECEQAYRDMLVYGAASMLLNEVTGEIERIDPSGLESWLPKAGDGTSFLGVDRSKPAELNAETFLAALLRDPPEPQPIYLHPREYEEMQQTVADQVAASMYAPTTFAGKWAVMDEMWRAGMLPGSPAPDDDDECDHCPCCRDCEDDGE